MNGSDCVLKLLIFDLDGTLIDSLRDLAEAANYALRAYKLPEHDIEKFRYFVGDGIPKLIERILPEDMHSDDMINKVKSVFDSYYSEHYADYTAPYNNIPELLRELKCKGYKLAVASNKPDNFTHDLVDSIFEGMFDVVQGKVDSFEKKPAPQIIYKISEDLGIPLSEAIMIGDTNVDIFTAKNAGIKSIGCLWGFRTKSELEEAGADFIVSDPIEILKYI